MKSAIIKSIPAKRIKIQMKRSPELMKRRGWSTSE